MHFYAFLHHFYCALFSLYRSWAHENLDFVSLLVALRSFSYWMPSFPKSRFALERRAIERFQRAMCPALPIPGVAELLRSTGRNNAAQPVYPRHIVQPSWQHCIHTGHHAVTKRNRAACVPCSLCQYRQRCLVYIIDYVYGCTLHWILNFMKLFEASRCCIMYIEERSSSNYSPFNKWVSHSRNSCL